MMSIARLLRVVVLCGMAFALTVDGSASPPRPAAHNTAPVVSLSATSLSPGWFPVGTTSEAVNLYVTNSGNAALTIYSVSLSGPNVGDFALKNGCPTALAASGSPWPAVTNCLITFTFTPSAPGTRTAYINIIDNAAGSPQKVTIYGTGEGGPTASLSLASLTFASQTVGATSAAQSITLSNTGSGALSISSLGLAGANPSDFAQTNNCGSSVAAGSSCTISVAFKPTAGGTFTAALALTDNAPGSPQSVSLSGTGAGTGTTITLSPSSLIFGNEAVDTTSSSQTITLSNTGSSALSISTISFTGADAADFTQVNTCNSAVAAGGSCTIGIMFTPPASGSATASLAIGDNASGSPQSVVLSGTGTHDVMLSWTASGTAGIMGYNLYRGTAPGAEGSTPINSAPITGTSYIDPNVTAGATYYYVLTSVASNGVTQSAVSAESVAAVPSP